MVVVEVVMGVVVSMMEATMVAPALEQPEFMGGLMSTLDPIVEVTVLGMIPAMLVFLLVSRCEPERHRHGDDDGGEDGLPDRLEILRGGRTTGPLQARTMARWH